MPWEMRWQKRSLSYPHQNANFQHFKELLAEYKQIKISYSALYTLLKKAGIVSPKNAGVLKSTAEGSANLKRDY